MVFELVSHSGYYLELPRECLTVFESVSHSECYLELLRECLTVFALEFLLV
jgi:hypothetical protein